MINNPTDRSWLALVVAMLLALLLAACATIRTGSHYDETTNFGAYETFSWIDDEPYVSDGTSPRIDPLTRVKIQAAIRDQLERKGYSFVAERDRADFVLAYSVGTRDRLRVESYPAEFRVYHGWHVYGSRYYVREIRTHSYTEGTLGVDIFDQASRKPVWHGWAEKTITESDRKDPTTAINEGVSRLFEAFPR